MFVVMGAMRGDCVGGLELLQYNEIYAIYAICIEQMSDLYLYLST